MRIFVVDDEKGIRLLLTEVFKRMGHDVLSFENMNDTLQEVRVNQPDLLFVDFMIGEHSGDKLIKQLREEEYLIPAIIMSGRAKSEIKKFFSDINFIYFLEKPFTINEVEELLKSISKNVVRA